VRAAIVTAFLTDGGRTQGIAWYLSSGSSSRAAIMSP
jgi:hypothetical protein